jgi:DNA-binding NarL/FixJ family response regulator
MGAEVTTVAPCEKLAPFVIVVRSRQETTQMPLRILLADDAPAVREAVKSLLEQAGFEVVGAAADGREAVRMAGVACPDVAVLDFSMPELDGLEVTRELHQLCPRTPVILLTQHAEEHQIHKAFSAGVRGYVLKTHAVDDLPLAIEVVSRGGGFLSSSLRLNSNDCDLPTLPSRQSR